MPRLSKTIEYIINKQLIDYLETNQLLSPTQFGFRKKYSTKLALADLVVDIAEKLDSGLVTLGIFIDLRKAFDTLNHDTLLKKLEHYGVRGVPLLWFKNYLSNRQQFVSINNTFSPRNIIECGVPQVSILGPILFLFYINDISNNLHR